MKALEPEEKEETVDFEYKSTDKVYTGLGDLLKNIKIVKETLNNMYNNLQYADGDLIDYFTYQIKAEESKYDYLIKQAKEKKIKII